MVLLAIAGCLSAQPASPVADSDTLASELIGRPFFREFGPEQHGAVPEVWGIAQADNGDVLAGSDDGLIVRSGGQFSLIELPDFGNVSAMAACGSRVAVGGYEQFGYFERNLAGEWTYQAGAVPGHVRLSRVPDVACRQGSSYFAGLHWLLIQSPLPALAPSAGVSALEPAPALKAIYSKAELSGLFNTSKGMLISGFAGGLFQLIEDKLVPLPGAELLPRETVMGLVEQDTALLVFMRHAGLWRILNGKAEKLPLPYQSDLSLAKPYVVRAMADGSIAIGTSTGELWWLRQDLSLRLRFEIDSDGVMALSHDAEQGLWVASRRAMFRVSWPSPWSLFDARFGLRGLPSKIEFYKGRAFVATSVGVFEQLPKQRFSMVGPANEQSVDLAVTADGLLSAYARGAYSIDRGEYIAATAGLDVYKFYVDPSRADRLFVIHYDGVAVFELRSKQWVKVAELGESTNQVGEILKIAPDEYLLDNSGGVAKRLRLHADGSVAELVDTVGAPAGASVLLQFPEGPVISQDKQLYLWHAGRWQRSEALEQLVGHRDVALSYVSKTGHHWIADSRFFAMREHKSDSFEPIALPSPGMRSDCIKSGANGLFLCTTSGLVRFSSKGSLAKPTVFKTQITRVSIDDRPMSLKAPISLGTESRVQFKFSVNSVLAPVRYRSRLVRKGQASDEVPWSDFSEQASFSLQALPADSYLIEAQAQTADSQVAGIAALEFLVTGNFWSGASGRAARWALAFAGTILLIALMLMLRNFVLARTARTLVSEVARRTLALAEQTQALEQANLQLATIANLDGLTGIANRRAFDQRMQFWLTQSPAPRSTLVLALLDLDHFKRFNDSHGHLAGDDLLVRFATFVSKINCTEADERVFARFGGEEFAILLRIAAGQTLDFLHPWLDSIRTNVQHEFADVGLTISLGYQQLKLPIDSGSASVDTLQVARTALLEAADQALYRAKNAGRNCIFAASVPKKSA